MTSPADSAVVDGIDVDALASAVRGCPAVDDLDSGVLGGVATYLPGRRVPGVRVQADRIEVHVRAVWNQPVSVVAGQIRQALASLAGGRTVDIVLTDIADPGQAKPVPDGESAGIPAVLADGTVESWTRPSAPDAPSGASSSAPTIPTVAEIRPNS
jgi:hypothetical protein